MRRLAPVLALALAACTNPDDILAVNGTVLSSDPVAGQVVHLKRGLNTQGFQYPGNTCDLANPLHEQVVDDEGTYGFEIFRVETRRAACFRAETTFPSGSVAWIDFGFYGPKNQLSPLRDWRSGLSLDGGVLQFEPVVPWPDDAPPVLMGSRVKFGVQLTHRAELLLTDGGVAWQAEDRFQVIDSRSIDPNVPLYAREALVLDAARLEDFEGTLHLSASLYDPDEELPLVSLGPVPSRTRAAEQLSLRGARVPLSRGLSCPELGTPCPLTDGDLAEIDAGLIEEVNFALPAEAIISSVVLRDAWVAGDRVIVRLGLADGGVAGEFEAPLPLGYSRAFASGFSSSVRTRDGGYAQLRQVWLVVPVDAGTPASRVTIHFASGLARAREVSIFGP